mmetsp:Transcript_94555/g.138058  ORF Transcript_94555/g.138058 Transcript_94555/m.138058 type:complete len:92 (+) Transcript_94555:145-420(+)
MCANERTVGVLQVCVAVGVAVVVAVGVAMGVAVCVALNVAVCVAVWCDAVCPDEPTIESPKSGTKCSHIRDMVQSYVGHDVVVRGTSLSHV